MAVIRHATVADVEGILAVGRTTWRATYTPLVGSERVESFLARWWTAAGLLPGIEQGRVWVAGDAGQVVATAAHSTHDRVLTLDRLYVLPSHHGRGIGTALLDGVAAAAGSTVDVIVLSYLDGNDAAGEFYTARGFVETHREKDNPGWPDDVWMARSLLPRVPDGTHRAG